MYYKINGAWCFDLLLLMLTFALSANLADEDDCCRRLKIFLNGLLCLKFGAPAETRGESTAVQSGFIWHQFLLISQQGPLDDACFSGRDTAMMK